MTLGGNDSHTPLSRGPLPHALLKTQLFHFPPTAVSATHCSSSSGESVPVVCKVAPSVRDTFKQLLTLKRTTINLHLLDLISISISQMARDCPSAKKILELGGLSLDPRAGKPCAGWTCSICKHREKCMCEETDHLFEPTQAHNDNARSRGWHVDVKYEEVTIRRPVVTVTRIEGFESDTG